MSMPKSYKKNIQHVWTILSSGVSVDQDSNNLTLFNIIDQIVIPRNQLVEMTIATGEKKPAAPVGFVLVSQWRKLQDNTDANGEVKVELLDPDGIMRQGAEYQINLPGKIERFRSRVQWGGVRVTTSGMYTFKISLKEEGQDEFVPVGEAYLKIQIVEDVAKKKKINVKVRKRIK